MKKTPEGELQAQVLEYLRKNKIYHIRMNMGADSGLPDIIACYKGDFLGIELKRPDKKGKATEQQKKVVADINKAGGFASFIDSIESLEYMLREVDICRHRLSPEPTKKKFWTS